MEFPSNKFELPYTSCANQKKVVFVFYNLILPREKECINDHQKMTLNVTES